MQDKNYSNMERKKRLNELKRQIEQKNSSGYLRFWEIINGIPTLVEEAKGLHGKSINLISVTNKEDAEVYKQYTSDQLNELAEEQKKDNVLLFKKEVSNEQQR